MFIDYPKNSRKWHLSAFSSLPTRAPHFAHAPAFSFSLNLSLSHSTDAYYTQESLDSLHTIDDYPALRNIVVPPNQYVCARNNGARRNPRAGPGAAEPPLAPPPGTAPLAYPDCATAPSPPASSSSSSSSASSSNSGSTESLAHYDAVLPPSPSYSHALPPLSSDKHGHAHGHGHGHGYGHTQTGLAAIPPAAPLRAGFTLAADRRLAPLEYLQNISPRARNPADDEALRQFQYTMAPL